MTARDLATALLVFGLAAAAAAQGTLTEYTVEQGFLSGTTGITVGPDGAVWFVHPDSMHVVGRITTAGAISYLPNPTFGNPSVQSANGPITSTGSDAWIAFSQTLVQMSAGGVSTGHALFGGTTFHQIDSMGWDGATTIWFTEYVNGSGGLSSYDFASDTLREAVPVPTECAGAPYSTGRDMARTPDGSLWYPLGTYACRIQRGGTVSSVKLPLFGADGMVSGPDGRIWTSGYTGTGHLQAFDPATCHDASCVTVYDLPSGPSGAHNVHGLTAGPDGRIWFVASNPDVAGSVKTDGTDFQSIVLPQGNSVPTRIVAGPPGDNSVWFTESTAQRVGRIQISGSGPPPPPTSRGHVVPLPPRTPMHVADPRP